MITLYKGVAGGIGWDEMAKPLTSYNEWYDLLFVTYSAFTILGILNVVTAVFVQSTARISEVDKDLCIQEHMNNDDSTMHALRDIFHEAAAGCEKGFISTAIMEQLLTVPETIAHLRFLGLSV